jgi:hypothetical protein
VVALFQLVLSPFKRIINNMIGMEERAERMMSRKYAQMQPLCNISEIGKKA